MKLFYKTIIMALLFLSMIIGGSCIKKNPYGTITIKILDALNSEWKYDRLSLEIVGVDVHYKNENTGSGGWFTISSKTKICELFKFPNNTANAIASSNKLPPGEINAVLLLLGSNNKILFKSRKAIPFNRPDEPGIKIEAVGSVQQNKTLELLLNFDGAASIQEIDDGTFKIDPHIKTKTIQL